MFILLFVTGFAVAQSNENMVCWSGLKCLSVDDFQGKDSSDSLTLVIGGEKSDALSALEFRPLIVQYDTINIFRFRGYFNRNLSWLNEDGSLLAHEQTHFNIQELIVRKANKALDSLFYHSGEKIDYDSLVTRMSNDRVLLDSKFDSETNHGLKTELNREWVQRINEEVEQLEGYGIPCDQ